DMIKRGWIQTRSTTEEMLKECLNFFEVENISSWHNKYNEEIQTSLFRTSLKYESNPGAVAAWIRRGEILSDSIQCKTWNPQKFKETLFELRSLTFKRDPNLFLQELRQKCSECGVAFVLLKAPEGCRASGVTKFLSKNKALIILSFRFLSNDHFWFSFFHEAGHLILHNKNSIFLEGISNTSNKEEDEANNFAAEILVPQRYKVELLSLKANKQSILNFSKTVGVHPGIIVGQMQHYNIIRRNQMNGFKRRYQWVTE
ncbi:ImmA/IrrE family metallo-endopeptidase, partial [Leptospira sp. id769339]|uniref:ImmA/IrrE family metallo-endopeptidase n=1 Tax=Leptospira sp. id769339 TaxID=2864221 RepID=UPI00214AC7F1